MSKKVAIVYGWAEGPRHAKRFRALLRAEGFSITRKLEDADVLIAHSGGIFLLPANMRAELVMLVGVPYWPGKHPSKSLREKIKLELMNRGSLRYLLRKSVFNCLYFVSKPVHHYRIWNSWRHNLYPTSKESSFIAVRNRHDTFTNHKEVFNLASNNNWNVVSLDGYHDDLWLHPESYVKILIAKLTLDR